MADDPRQLLGKRGEDLACAELERHGYEIIERRYRTRHGEIDVVARDRDTIVFVEVKARLSDDYGGAAAAITRGKQRRIAQMALDFLSRRHWHDRPCRFDAVTIDIGSDGARLTLYADAFSL